jgi:hypothetical protein
MNCDQVIPLLSAYYDGELPSVESAGVADHVASCSGCASRLESLQHLKGLVHRSPAPPVPTKIVNRVEAALRNETKVVNQPTFSRRQQLAMVVLATAAAFLGIMVWLSRRGSRHDHHEMAATYGEFLDAYAAGKNDAPQVLVNRFQGKPIKVQEASYVLKHDSVARPTLLANHEATNRYLLKMPDCDCVATVYACEGKTSLVLFEHDGEHPEWFGKRSMTRTECAGKSCCLVPLDGSMVATWKANGGYITAVGIRDEAQLEQLIGELVKS